MGTRSLLQLFKPQNILICQNPRPWVLLAISAGMLAAYYHEQGGNSVSWLLYWLVGLTVLCFFGSIIGSDRKYQTYHAPSNGLIFFGCALWLKASRPDGFMRSGRSSEEGAMLAGCIIVVIGAVLLSIHILRMFRQNKKEKFRDALNEYFASGIGAPWVCIFCLPFSMLFVPFVTDNMSRPGTILWMFCCMLIAILSGSLFGARPEYYRAGYLARALIILGFLTALMTWIGFREPEHSLLSQLCIQWFPTPLIVAGALLFCFGSVESPLSEPIPLRVKAQR